MDPSYDKNGHSEILGCTDDPSLPRAAKPRTSGMVRWYPMKARFCNADHYVSSHTSNGWMISLDPSTNPAENSALSVDTELDT